MARGTVKWFNSQKGYGFIQPTDGGRDVFVHISAVERAGLSSLNEGQQIEFEIEENRGKSSAVNLQGEVGDQLASPTVAGIRPSSAPSCSRTGSRSPSIASRTTERANSSGFTVVLPIDLSVSHASSNAVSNTTSVGGSKELLRKPRIVPPPTTRTNFARLANARRKLGQVSQPSVDDHIATTLFWRERFHYSSSVELDFGSNKKTTYGGGTTLSALSLTVTRRVRPPSPSPSITRRRTPAALAVGVHPFQGTAPAKNPQRQLNSDRPPSYGLRTCTIRDEDLMVPWLGMRDRDVLLEFKTPTVEPTPPINNPLTNAVQRSVAFIIARSPGDYRPYRL